LAARGGYPLCRDRIAPVWTVAAGFLVDLVPARRSSGILPPPLRNSGCKLRPHAAPAVSSVCCWILVVWFGVLGDDMSIGYFCLAAPFSFSFQVQLPPDKRLKCLLFSTASTNYSACH
jgi:hypothetical protein